MSSNEKNIPKRRFKEFIESEAWEERELGQIGKTQSGIGFPDVEQGGTDGIPFFKVSDMNNAGNEHEMVSANNYVSDEQLQRKKWKPIKTLPAVMFAKVGAAIMLNRKRLVRIPFLIDNNTMAYIFDNSWHANFGKTLFETINLPLYAQVGALPSYNSSDIESIKVKVPQKYEQEKIGEFFSNVENLITLHQRKLDKLKVLKKAYLAQMFPSEGESKPRLRFSGFNDDWEQRKFKELVVIERGGSPRPIEDFITNSDEGLNWIKIGDAPAHGNYITKTKEKIRPEGLSKTREVHPGDLILSNSMSFGKPYIMCIDGCIHDGWLLIRDTNEMFDLKYLCCVLGTEQMLSQYRAMAAGSTVNNLNKDLVGNTIVKYPSKKEQVLIGQYISNIDNLITLHQRKLEKLQNIKKAYLNEMFV